MKLKQLKALSNPLISFCVSAPSVPFSDCFKRWVNRYVTWVSQSKLLGSLSIHLLLQRSRLYFCVKSLLGQGVLLIETLVGPGLMLLGLEFWVLKTNCKWANSKRIGRKLNQDSNRPRTNKMQEPVLYSYLNMFKFRR